MPEESFIMTRKIRPAAWIRFILKAQSGNITIRGHITQMIVIHTSLCYKKGNGSTTHRFLAPKGNDVGRKVTCLTVAVEYSLNGAARFRLGGAKRDFFFGRGLFSRFFPALVMSENPTYNGGIEARERKRRNAVVNTKPIRKLTEEETKMVQENMDLIIRMSQKEHAGKRGDYRQDLALTLCAAAQAYRPGKGASFRTYVSTCLKNKTGDYKKREYEREYAEALEFCDEIEPLLKGLEDEETKMEREASWTVLETEVLKQVARYSPRIQKGALTLLWSAKGYTRSQIAARLHTTPYQITLWSKAAKKKLAQSHKLRAMFINSIGA